MPEIELISVLVSHDPQEKFLSIYDSSVKNAISNFRSRNPENEAAIKNMWSQYEELERDLKEWTNKRISEGYNIIYAASEEERPDIESILERMKL